MNRPFMSRQLNNIDRLLSQLGQGLQIALGPSPTGSRSNPANTDDSLTEPAERRHAAGLMRVNHTGEVCAQALYSGQAFTSKNTDIQQKMRQAADEEIDHLAWCAERLQELDSQPSRLNLFWYSGSWFLGASAGIAGDKWNLGFLEETERQVEAHLEGHLDQLPAGDQRSREIVEQMKIDEAEHADMAARAGAAPLPRPIKEAMRFTADIMRWLAYRI